MFYLTRKDNMKNTKDVIAWLEEEVEHCKDYINIKYSYLEDVQGRYEMACELLDWIKETPKDQRIIPFKLITKKVS
jgi:adenine C2-methylase RlmN of 23S rRNA A2503 and tRNA A37